ncbi:hypothetical protein N7931_13250 [Catenovulum sp. 2E275]|uniref:hypothetical protein n=1 Tax=Catenovulum sp. 2E275 TaxID=2980497 RepID=UPI0021CE7EA2|nr:hypothetical protein [Catenovulum sp. 2E275]MCU4676598.1 hypothetical protein [Catenovulum sp. 2E275]
MKNIAPRRYIFVFIKMLLITVTLSLLAYWLSGQIWVAALTFVILFVIVRFNPRGGLYKRRKNIDLILTDQINFNLPSPLLDKAEEKEWIRGFGFIDVVDQLMWVKATKQGLALFYWCYRRKGAILVSWDLIYSIKLQENSSQARIAILNTEHNLIVPWSKEFNNLVPDKVGFINKV